MKPICRKCGVSPTAEGLASIAHKLRKGNEWIYVHREGGHDIFQRPVKK